MVNRWTLYIIQRPVSAIVFHDGVLDTTKLSSHFWPLKSREKDIRSRGLFIGLVQNWRVAGLNTKYTNMYHIQTCIKYRRSSYHKRVFMNLCIYRGSLIIGTLNIGILAIPGIILELLQSKKFNYCDFVKKIMIISYKYSLVKPEIHNTMIF